MYALVSPEKIQLPPGAVVRLPATWQDYQALCQQRGDGSIPRIKYRDGEVLLQSPLPAAEYVLQTSSRYFPNIPVQDVIARCMQIAYSRNTSAAIRDLKQQLSSAL